MPDRARDLGIRIGRGEPGSLNAITDVAGVRVGHKTIVRGEDGDPHAARTGVTAIFPHEGSPWRQHVYAAPHILNGYGEMIGINQIAEWGLLMSPIVLTSSLAIGKAYDATVRWMAVNDPEASGEVMPVVSECDDSYLNDVMSFPLSEEDVAAALDSAAGGPVREGCVGSGMGMQCFDLKGGIGTASRVLTTEEGGYTVGVLVMTNHGSRPTLVIDGVRVGEAITEDVPDWRNEGSCVAVVATDAPLLPHQLRRMAQRAGMGLARGGSVAHNGSGEQMLAFSTANRIPAYPAEREAKIRALLDGSEDDPYIFSALFEATIEATEEAVVNALLAAETTVGHHGHRLIALPVEPTLELLEKAGRLVR